MDEIKYITKYLDDTYSVIVGHNQYQIKDKKAYYDFGMTIEESIHAFYLIFGKYDLEDGSDSSTIMYNWFDSNKAILGKKLNEVLNSIDGTKGSDIHLEEFLELFEDDNDFKPSFIKYEFRSFYKRKFIDVKLDEYLNTIKLSNGSMFLDNDFKLIFFLDIKLFGLEIEQRIFGYYQAMMAEKIDEYLKGLDGIVVASSNELIANSPLNIDIEDDKIKQINLHVLNEWYSGKFIREKLDKFFPELVITLGPRNWRVTWIGHGELTKDKLLDYLQEDEYHLSYITQQYDKWYEDAIIEASERYMKF